MKIPPLNPEGLLPAFTDPLKPESSIAPYQASACDLVRAFGFSEKRVELICRLLQFRSDLRLCGFEGWQWIGGSFVESKPEPRDMDVITFRRLTRPIPAHLQGMAENLADHDFILENYGLDNHHVRFEWNAETLARKTKHWYALFSHQRETQKWKGFLEIPLEKSGALDKAVLKLQSLKSIAKALKSR